MKPMLPVEFTRTAREIAASDDDAKSKRSRGIGLMKACLRRNGYAAGLEILDDMECEK